MCSSDLTRDPDIIAAADLVFDVGRMYDSATLRFDHHQPGAPVRENNIAYSAFGLLWLKYGVQFCDGDEQVAGAVATRLVQVVDANDNGTAISQPVMEGVRPYEIFDVLYQENPLFDSGEDYDEQYGEAVALGRKILDRLVLYERSVIRMRHYFNEQVASAKDKRFVVLDKPGDYKSLAAGHDALLYFIAPDAANDTWGVTAVSRSDSAFDLKYPLPEDWAGLEGQELAEATGVPDATFCHLKRFYAVAKTKGGAERLLRLALPAEDEVEL